MPGATTRPTRGHKKKARTRQLLVRCAAEVIAQRGVEFTVTEVVERAGVSNGTFYNYFDDRDDLVDQLVPELIGDFTDQIAATAETDEPALRFATISAMVLDWAATSPTVAEAVLRLEVFQRPDVDDALFGHLRKDLDAGITAGDFNGDVDAATVDVIGGALLMATRRLVAAGPDPAYQEDVLARLLQALGVSLRTARSTAARAMAVAAGHRSRRSL